MLELGSKHVLRLAGPSPFIPGNNLASFTIASLEVMWRRPALSTSVAPYSSQVYSQSWRLRPPPTSPLPMLDFLRIQERSDLSTIYDMIFRAERHAVQQEAEENIMTARVTGYLLLELHAQAGIFGDAPYTSLVNLIISPPRSTGGNEHDVVYHVGKFCCATLIRLCMFDYLLLLLTLYSPFLSSSKVRLPNEHTLLKSACLGSFL